MRIKVTDSEIAVGERDDPTACPIALALNDVLPDADIEVQKHKAWIDGKPFDLPAEAVVFIEDFDENGGESVHPFEFNLPIDHLIKDSNP